MGAVDTHKLGDVDLEFPEHSRNKRMNVQPDIAECDSEKFAPKFDLILGAETMRKPGIKLIFKEQMIETDQTNLPMRKMSEFKKPNRLCQIYKNTEPDLTEQLTKRVVEILDANYEKANLPDVVSKNCDHLNEEQKSALLEVL